MKTFFQPDSIAVIGASPRENSLGGQLVVNLLYGYKGRIYPVNPNYDEILGLTTYPDIEAIPGPVELAIIIVPAPAVPETIEACSRKGVRRIIIESAGFAETGPVGRVLQERCLAVARAPLPCFRPQSQPRQRAGDGGGRGPGPQRKILPDKCVT